MPDPSHLKFARRNVAFWRGQLEAWREAVERHPGLETLQPQKERVLRMNVEAAEERARGEGVRWPQ